MTDTIDQPTVRDWRSPSQRTDGYQPLRSYAAIGDGRTVALIADDGQIDWLPLPEMNTAPVIAGLLDAGRGGFFELRPTADFEVDRSYLEGTNVLTTRFRTATGEVEVTDALVTGVAGRLPWSELVRRIEGVEGSVEMTWAVVPGNVFGTHDVERVDTVHGPVLRAGDVNLVLIGSDHGRTDPTGPGDGVSDEAAEFRGAFTTTPGSRTILCLCGTDDEPVHIPNAEVVDQGVDRTVDNWALWSKNFSWDGPWSEAVTRSTLALKLLIYSPTGAIAAAATAAVPENFTGLKNWDYRFAWVRDLAYTVQALLNFGLREEPHAAVSWILSCLKEHGREMHIFFTLDGGLPDGTTLTEAEGWRGIGPVYDGNPASGQLQLGVFADILAILSQYASGGNIIDASTDELLCSFADEACRRWQEEDSGMWELGDLQHYTSSKMGCWQAIDAACHLADIGQLHPSDDDLAHWKKNARLIREYVDEKCWSESRGAYLMYPGSQELDASVLLHAPTGFDRGERMSRTIDALRDELGRGPLLYRYSGMDAEEGTFTACAFWCAAALACVGRLDEAVALMDELMEQVNDVGMLSEMISENGEFLGNLPQGLSHLALVNAVITIDQLTKEKGEDEGDEVGA
ncbi:GH15 family glucan-1,4-alpha-glucosidase [Frondihabitans sp. PhB188]|uniref:glycoside hydrolase family 15 protein n=1 Tax=Frondihabitans sp. PhB188 TaxID=2485200 RepID=UPI000FB19E05|nr:glycoside hydrolase family 15 protein [Frondihabitans sp. PhB188]ROQ38248.1 GH15 family glucan-1,4-alpha-glucosidase [Frondihabitans sp. PhB188]